MINTKYPLWQLIVDNKARWIGGTLAVGEMETKIIDITIKPEGDDAFFLVTGIAFDCGFDVSVGEIWDDLNGWIGFRGDNRTFKIKDKKSSQWVS